MVSIENIFKWQNNRVLQIQTGGDKYGQFYIGDGYISYSGGLDSGYEGNQKFRKLSYEKLGQVWFFRNDYATASNGIEYMMKFRVFEVI